MAPSSSVPRFDAFRALSRRRGLDGDALMGELRRAALEAPDSAQAGAQAGAPAGARGGAPAAAERLGLPAAAGLGPATFYADLAAPHAARHVRVCNAAACFSASAGTHLSEVESALGLPAGTADPHSGTSLQTVRCLGYCYAGPAALDGDAPRAGPALAAQLAGRARPQAPDLPAADATGDPVLLVNGTSPEPVWQVWPRTVATRTPGEIRDEVAASGLRGRGGGGFPVAEKWAAAGGAPGTVVIANGDEGDPGSFADRVLMETDPARVLEGLALACFACGARRGVVLVRSEYPEALRRLGTALEAAYADGHLGEDVHGCGVDLDLTVTTGSGSYVAGEETALIADLEGRRGCARPKPPYPVREGLWDAPTVINNVETLASVVWIVARGGAAYARRGLPGETGTKLVCLSERFARPGCYEVELGTSLRWIVTELGGGPAAGAEFAVVQVGGPLGGFLPADGLDVPLSEAALARHGSALGHAGLVAFDQRVEPADVLRHVWEFAEAESCGACSPCRVGSRRGRLLAMAGEPPGEEYARLLRVMSEASLCAFGRRVPPAVRSLARAYGARLAGWDA